jgi:tetratricopeptide (TPR) repeat protein
MEENIIQKAIDSALRGDWDEAIKINSEILKIESEDVDALNRLARAYYEKGNLAKAKKTLLDVLEIDPLNKIACNSLERYKQIKSKGSQNVGDIDFIEVPGKTKLALLINLGSEKTYSVLNSGDEVLLVPHSHKVSVTTLKGAYIGRLADDLSARMRPLLKAGNKYKTIVKSVNKNCVKIFIKGDSISFPREQSESLSEFSS